MTSNEHPRDEDEAWPPPEAAEVDLAARDIAASAEERFVTGQRVSPAARMRFAALVFAVLLIHAVVIAAFLWRDQHDKTQVAEVTETPVEVVVEPPPEPQKPPPPPKPEPPKPKEDLSPAFSAPRAPSEQKIETEKTQEKNAAPKAAAPPSEGQPTPTPQAAPPKEQAPDETKKDEAAKEEDKSKPDAEALDKAKQKPAKESKTKQAKVAPKPKQKTADLLASLAGETVSPDLSFTKPTPKTKIYGGTEDVRWMSEVEAMLEAKVGQLPRTAHWHDGGKVAIFFHVDVSGRVISKEIIVKSGYPDIDSIAERALASAAPFPPPPPGIERGLVWVSKFDGQLPTLHIEKR